MALQDWFWHTTSENDLKAKTERDYELVRSVIAGDNGAFRQLVFLYKDHSLSLIRSILKDPVKSEDVLQDAFISVYKNMNKFKFNASFSSWLYRIMVNASYNELKKNKRYVQWPSEERIEATVEPNSLTASDQKVYINKALDAMKPDEALVLRLHYLNELKIKEIEGITGFGRSKIKVDLHRGRDNFHSKLKQLLGKDINYLL